MHHSVSEMCVVGYGSGELWDLCDGFIRKTMFEKAVIRKMCCQWTGDDCRQPLIVSHAGTLHFLKRQKDSH